MRFCDVDALATGQPMGHSPEVSFMARPLSHAVGQKLPPGAGGFATCHLTEFHRAAQLSRVAIQA